MAVVLQAVTAAGTRPDNPLLNQLSLVLSVSQIFALPWVIAVIMARRWRTSALVMAVTTAVHFAPYSWLYRTPQYLVLGAVIAIGIAVLQRVADRRDESSEASGWQVAALVGVSLLAASVYALAP